MIMLGATLLISTHARPSQRLPDGDKEIEMGKELEKFRPQGNPLDRDALETGDDGQRDGFVDLDDFHEIYFDKKGNAYTMDGKPCVDPEPETPADVPPPPLAHGEGSPSGKAAPGPGDQGSTDRLDAG